MAIEFARAKAISRSSGGNVCRTAAYNARVKIKDQTTGSRYNFSHKDGNLYHQIILPDYADAKFKNLSILMNEVERHNVRVNSQLALEVVLALPDNSEITLKDRIELTRRFIDEMGWVKEGLGVVVDIHAPDENDVNNHAHLIVLNQHRFRKDGLGFSDGKARDLQPDFRYNKILTKEEKLPGKVWRKIQNNYFIENGMDIKVDAISMIPHEHIGPVRMRNILNQAIARNEDKAIGHQKIIQDPEELIRAITKTQAVFTKADVEFYIKKIESPELRAQIVDGVFASTNVISLQDKDAKSLEPRYFTTKAVRKEEQRLLRAVFKINEQENLCANSQMMKNLDRFKNGGDLSGHLSQAQLSVLINLMTSENGLRIFRGRAGTGKTHLLGFANYMSQEIALNVIGLAPTHKAALELEAVGFKTCDTLKGFLFKLHNGKTELLKDSLIILDEAGMVDTPSLLELAKVARARGCNVILSGDELQLTSIERGGMFEVLADKFGSFELSQIRRQEFLWGREMAGFFARGNVRAGIKLLKENKGLLHRDSLQNSMMELVEDFTSSPNEIKNMLAITVRNKEVDAINESIREVLKAQGRLRGSEYLITKEEGQEPKGYMKGDRIVFGSTPKTMKAKNGDFATLISVAESQFIAKLDKDNTEVVFNPSEMHNFKHGYASTTYKAQGASIKEVYVLHNGVGSSRSAYVAMTRFVESMKLYTNQNATRTGSELIRQLSIKDQNSASLAFMTNQEVDRILENGGDEGVLDANKTTMQKVGSWFKELRTDIGDRLHTNPDYYKFEAEPLTNARIEKALEEVAIEVHKRRSRPEIIDLSHATKIKASKVNHDGFPANAIATKPEILMSHDSFAGVKTTQNSHDSLSDKLLTISPNLLEYQHKLGSEDAINYMAYQDARGKSESAHEFLKYGNALYQTAIASITMNKEFGINLEQKTDQGILLIKEAQEAFASKIETFHEHLSSDKYQECAEKIRAMGCDSSRVDLYRILVRDVSLIHKEQMKFIGLKPPEPSIDIVAKATYDIISSYKPKVGRGQNHDKLTNHDIEAIATKVHDALCKGSWWKNEAMKSLELEQKLIPVLTNQSDSHSLDDSKALGSNIATSIIDKKAVSKTLTADIPSPTFRTKATYEKFNHAEETDALRLKAIACSELIAKDLLGEPNKHLSNRRTLRFGEHGKFVIQITGEKSGIWYDHSQGRGGDLFGLVSKEKNCTFKEAKDYIKDIVGVPDNIRYIRGQETEALYKQNLLGLLKQQNLEAQKIRKAQELYAKTSPLSLGAVAARYLKEHRKIKSLNFDQQDKSQNTLLSNDLRTAKIWNKKARSYMPALIAFARDGDGTITGGQQIFLNKDTAQKADLHAAKLSFGKISSSMVKIQDANVNGITIIAEGLETALSLQEARIEGKILCSLGVSNIKNYTPMDREKIILAADNDGKGSSSQKAITQAREVLEERGAIVSIIVPKELGDFNDLLKAGGREAILSQFNPEILKLSKNHTAVVALIDQKKLKQNLEQVFEELMQTGSIDKIDLVQESSSVKERAYFTASELLGIKSSDNLTKTEYELCLLRAIFEARLVKFLNDSDLDIGNHQGSEPYIELLASMISHQEICIDKNGIITKPHNRLGSAIEKREMIIKANRLFAIRNNKIKEAILSHNLITQVQNKNDKAINHILAEHIVDHEMMHGKGNITSQKLALMKEIARHEKQLEEAIKSHSPSNLPTKQTNHGIDSFISPVRHKMRNEMARSFAQSPHNSFAKIAAAYHEHSPRSYWVQKMQEEINQTEQKDHHHQRDNITNRNRSMDI